MPVPSRHAPRLAAVAALLLAGLAAALAAPVAAQARATRAVLAFLPRGAGEDAGTMLDRLDARPQLALGLVSATQGHYTPRAGAARHHAGVAHVDLGLPAADDAAGEACVASPRRMAASSSAGAGSSRGRTPRSPRSSRACSRAASRAAPRTPACGTRRNLEAVAAADRDGDIAAVSLGRAADLGERAHRLLVHHRFVVVGLPGAERGDAVLDRLLRDHRRGDVLIVVQSPHDAATPQLLPAGTVLPRGSSGVLTSRDDAPARRDRRASTSR